MPGERYFAVNTPPVVLETVDEETIIVNLDTGSYYDLNHVGGHLLHELEGGAELSAAVDAVANRYEADRELVAGDAAQLVRELVAEGILSEGTSPPPSGAALRAGASSDSNGASPSVAPRRSYERPALAKFTDMQELLLLDPVHEVDEAGWPNKA